MSVSLKDLNKVKVLNAIFEKESEMDGFIITAHIQALEFFYISI